jgi:hypothetical protein
MRGASKVESWQVMRGASESVSCQLMNEASEGECDACGQVKVRAG